MHNFKEAKINLKIIVRTLVFMSMLKFEYE